MDTDHRMDTEPTNLSPNDVQRGLKLSIVEGAFATVHIQLTGGIFLSGLALLLRATDFEIGLLGALPALLSPMAFAAVPLVAVVGARRPVALIASVLGRGLFLVPALLLLFGRAVSFPEFLVLIVAFNALVAIAGSSWTSWMSDLVPQGRWGRYFGLRNAILGVVGMAVAFLGAKTLDAFRAAGQTGTGFGWLFAVAVACSSLAAVLLRLQPEPSLIRGTEPLRSRLSAPLHNRQFRQLLAFTAFWYGTSGVASPFFGVYMLGGLRMSYAAAAVYGIIAGATALVFQLFWGRAIDRFRAKPVLELSFVGVAALPLFWLFATPTFLTPIWADSLLTGVFWTGVNAALFAMVLGSARATESRESTVALFTTVTGLCGFCSAVAGGVIAEALAGMHFVWLGRTFINYDVLFVLASAARFASLLLLFRVEDPGAASARVTLVGIGDYGLRRLSMAKDLRPRSLALGMRRPSPDALEESGDAPSDTRDSP